MNRAHAFIRCLASLQIQLQQECWYRSYSDGFGDYAVTAARRDISSRWINRAEVPGDIQPTMPIDCPASLRQSSMPWLLSAATCMMPAAKPRQRRVLEYQPLLAQHRVCFVIGFCQGQRSRFPSISSTILFRCPILFPAGYRPSREGFLAACTATSTSLFIAVGILSVTFLQPGLYYQWTATSVIKFPPITILEVIRNVQLHLLKVSGKGKTEKPKPKIMKQCQRRRFCTGSTSPVFLTWTASEFCICGRFAAPF